jgi:hypothetical protein
LPFAATAWRVGARGRLTMFGADAAAGPPPALALRPFASQPSPRSAAPAALVEGYPEFDAPIIQYLLRRRSIPVESHVRTWLEPRDYHRYRIVVIAGDLARAGLKHNTYDAAELAEVRRYVEEGGTLWLLRRGKRVFDWSKEGQQLLQEWTGQQPRIKDGVMSLTAPQHPWVRHLSADTSHPWLAAKLDGDLVPLRPTTGERIISAPAGTTNLYRVGIGKGQLIYTGWQVAASLPLAGTVEEESRFEEQVRILANVIDDAYGR